MERKKEVATQLHYLCSLRLNPIISGFDFEVKTYKSAKVVSIITVRGSVEKYEVTRRRGRELQSKEEKFESLKRVVMRNEKTLKFG
jgi:hypothetical protein